MRPRLRKLLVFVLLALALPVQGAVIHELTSAYHHIAVLDEAGLRVLSFNGSQETRMSLANPLAGHFGYTELFHMPLLLHPGVSNVLMIGLGGGSTQRAYAFYHPGVRVDTVEVDPAVVAIAKRFFHVEESPAHRIHVADGRVFLKRSQVKYDAILMDAYEMGRYGSQPPFHLVTQEFFQLAAASMSTNGVLAYNMIGTAYGWKSDAVGSLQRTMKTVFPQVSWIPAADSQNVVLVATKSREPLAISRLQQKYDYLVRQKHLFPPGFRERINALRTNLPPAARTAVILQDKFAPPAAF